MNTTIQEREYARKAFEAKLQADPEFARSMNYTRGSMVELVPTVHYVTSLIEGTTIDFVTTSQPKKAGEQSFNDDKLDSGKPFILAQAHLEYAKEPSATPLTVSTADYKDAEPAVLKNGDVVLNQNGELLNVSFSALANNTAPNNNLDKGINLANFPIIKPQVAFTVTGKLPAAISGTDVNYAKIVMRGYTPVVR